MSDLERALPAREVNSSPGGDKRPQWKKRMESKRGSVPPGWITGGRGRARQSMPLDEHEERVRKKAGVAYAELHCHTNFSFKEGASEGWDLLMRAVELGLHAVALTDHDNLCGAMEFAQAAEALGIKAVIGVEVTLATSSSSGQGGHHITLLAENATGYSNICRLVTRAHMDPVERNQPALDPALLASHAEGVICLSGCRRGEISELLMAGEYEAARDVAAQYAQWFGSKNFFLELQQNLVKGDARRNKLMARLGGEIGIGIVATNNVHYHVRERHRLNDALVAIQHNKSLEETHRERRPNDQFYLKSPEEIAALFASYPEAIANTAAIADRCQFDLVNDIRDVYSFPGYDLPEGETEIERLKEICEEAAKVKYADKDGETLVKLRERLVDEFRLIEKHDLAGFLLQYHDIIKIAHEVQIELGVVDPGTTIEKQPPGRGRGSSVALVVGYLIGLSHIDPIQFDLKLERFLPDISEEDDLKRLPALDIDLDFPREIREKLILRVHERKGPEFAALTGMISTYKIRGAIRDLGKALGLPAEDLDQLIKLIDGHAGIKDLPSEMAQLPEYRDRVNVSLWKTLVELSQELNHFPKYLAQHPGGMILSARPLSDAVPMQRSAIDGRFICQWEKDSADDAGFVKIDFLALGALSQMTEALKLIRRHKEDPVDLSRIDFTDTAVYEDIHKADTIGIFQIESAAQMQTVVRLKPKNLKEMAWEVGAVRPGVGVNDGVSMLIRRHLGLEEVRYEHKSEEKALERTLGVPLFQDQLAELAMSVAGMTTLQGDQMRRAFTRRDKNRLIPEWHKKFIEGALKNDVPLEAAEKIFKKFHGEYQFPEAHAYAFGITAYQMSWLKHYHKLEFYVGLFNNQPMGFYNLETLKEDARRHEITVLNPDVNLSEELATVAGEKTMRLGLTHVANVRKATAELILATRRRYGPFKSLADFMERTGVQHEALDSLTAAGAFDCFDPHHQSQSEAPADRRSLRWEIGLRYRPVNQQLAFELPIEQDMVALPQESEWEQMMGEYGSMGVYPAAHIMKHLRPRLPRRVERSDNLKSYSDGDDVTVAGLVIRRQRPSGKATFITLEDEFGHSPLVIWPAIYKRIRRQTTTPLVMAQGKVSRRDGTLNIVVEDAWALPSQAPDLKTKDWG